MNIYKNFGKRTIDFLIAAIMLLIIWPLLLIIAVIVKLDSKGPAVFVQDRLTLGGKVFKPILLIKIPESRRLVTYLGN